MAKVKSVFVCQNCGNESPKWIGKCYACSEWNTFVEERIVQGASAKQSSIEQVEKSKPKSLSSINFEEKRRLDTSISEFNRILGGGIVPGSLILLGGEPGIGKSTLALQVALGVKGLKVLYVSGEESEQQIKFRANRLADINEGCLIYSETILENIESQIENVEPDLVVMDSIQTVYTDRIESSTGSVSQIRECTGRLMKLAKTRNIPVLLIGHITKDGSIAGPKVLEHMVDTVLQFEGDQNHIYRILRASKNRFGSTSELGIFEMQASGLKEVLNPSEIFLSQSEEKYSGVSVATSVDGARPFMLEIQALVGAATYGNPQRVSTGFDNRRLNMLLAVLEKRAGFQLTTKDIFLNIAGGLKVNDPAIDLAVISSVLSSITDIGLDRLKCFAGEVGLTGEVRPVSRIEARIGEAEKLGFESVYVSAYNLKGIDRAKYKINIETIRDVGELMRRLFK